MFNQPAGRKASLWASAANTFTAAGSSSQTPTLPGGAVGTPVICRASGGVSGLVTVNISNTQTVLVPVNPNAPFTEVELPPGAFPVKTGQVSVTLEADGAGPIRCLIGFTP